MKHHAVQTRQAGNVSLAVFLLVIFLAFYIYVFGFTISSAQKRHERLERKASAVTHALTQVLKRSQFASLRPLSEGLACSKEKQALFVPWKQIRKGWVRLQEGVLSVKNLSFVNGKIVINDKYWFTPGECFLLRQKRTPENNQVFASDGQVYRAVKAYSAAPFALPGRDLDRTFRFCSVLEERCRNTATYGECFEACTEKIASLPDEAVEEAFLTYLEKEAKDTSSVVIVTKDKRIFVTDSRD